MNEEITCRICFDSEPINQLIKPCDCDGSSKFVHRQCLKKWIRLASNREAANRCMECRKEYIKKENNIFYYKKVFNVLTKCPSIYYILQQTIIFVLNYITSKILYNNWIFYNYLGIELYNILIFSSLLYLFLQTFYTIIYTLKFSFWKEVLKKYIFNIKSLNIIFIYIFSMIWIYMFVPILCLILLNSSSFLFLLYYFNILRGYQESYIEIVDLNESV